MRIVLKAVNSSVSGEGKVQKRMDNVSRTNGECRESLFQVNED